MESSIIPCNQFLSKAYEFINSDYFFNNKKSVNSGFEVNKPVDSKYLKNETMYTHEISFYTSGTDVEIKIRDCSNLIEYQLSMYKDKFSLYIWNDLKTFNNKWYNEKYNISPEEYFFKSLEEELYYDYKDIGMIKKFHDLFQLNVTNKG